PALRNGPPPRRARGCALSSSSTLPFAFSTTLADVGTSFALHSPAPQLPQRVCLSLLLRSGETLRGRCAFLLPAAMAEVESYSSTRDYSQYGEAVTVNLAEGTATGLAGVSGVANVIGTPFDDVIIGNSEANMLRGLGGKTILVGFDGADPQRQWTATTCSSAGKERTCSTVTDSPSHPVISRRWRP